MGKSKLLQADVSVPNRECSPGDSSNCGSLASLPGKTSGPGWVGANRHIPTFWFICVRGSFSPEDEKWREPGAEPSFFSLFLSEVHYYGLGTVLTCVHSCRGMASPRYRHLKCLEADSCQSLSSLPPFSLFTIKPFIVSSLS